jgi:hypothetical protein
VVTQFTQLLPALVCVSLLLTQVEAVWSASAEAPIDEPRVLHTADFSTQLRGYFSAHGNRASLDLTRDARANEEFGDLQWLLQGIVNKRQSLAGLSDVGVTQRSDGSVELDVKRHPKWMPLHERLVPFDNPDAFDAYIPLLRDRGFRESDLAKVRQYLQSNRLGRVTFEASKPEINAFSSHVRSRVVQQVSIAQAKSFHYRLRRLSNEAQRNWAAGLLGTLDSQRQRILVSLLDELGVVKVVAPDSDVEGFLAREIAAMRSPTFDQAIQTKELEYKQ